MTVEYKRIEGEALPEFGEFYDWQGFGDSIEGIYERRRVNPARTVDGQSFKEQNLYDIRLENGALVTLNGNFDLDSKMKKVRLQSPVKITYEEDREIGRGLSAMRIFEVLAGAVQKKASPVPFTK